MNLQPLYTTFALILSLPTAAAHADIVFDNGQPRGNIGGNAYALTSSVQADDFSLDAPQTIAAVRFWALERHFGFSGSVLWTIRADDGGKPAASSIASDLATPSRIATGFLDEDHFAAPESIVEFGITPLTLPAGHYWLTLHNGPLTFDLQDNAQHFFLWEESAAVPRPGNGFEDPTLFDDSWQITGGEAAFQLLVPEPTTLLTTFLALIIGLSRRRTS